MKKRERLKEKEKVIEIETGRVTKSVDIIVLILNHKVAAVEATALHTLGSSNNVDTL